MIREVDGTNNNAAYSRPQDYSRFLVVGIGASAGGLEPLRQFLSNVSADSGMAFVVIMHLDPEHHSLLPEILSTVSPIPVRQVHDDTPIEPNYVYAVSPNTALNIEGGVLRPATFGHGESRRNVIDAFFESLSRDQDSYAVGIVLSGSGSDGTLGLRAIKGAAGVTIAQDPNTAEFDSMPRSAILSGFVDDVLSVEQIPARLSEYAAHLRELDRSLQAAPIEDGERLRRICAILKERTGHDFTYYKQNTLARRMQRRMQVTNSTDVVTYMRRLREDHNEAELLQKEFLIGVTNFFRDPEAFEALESVIIPAVFEEKDESSSVRVWVTGCSTGEEAYSIAILIAEHRRKVQSSAPIQIFATDIDERALAIARRGHYPQGIADQVSQERLERYFNRVGDAYQISPEIRELCVFSAHNLLRDPLFSRIDLVSCRNLLIYLQAEAQGRVLLVLHHALRPGGFLLLGQAENVASHSNLFEDVSETRYVFRREDALSPGPLIFPMPQVERPILHSRQVGQLPSDEVQRRRLGETFRRTLLEEYAPAAVMISERGEILETSGQTRAYLQLPQGSFENNLFSMVRRSMLGELCRAFKEAVRERRMVTAENAVLWTESGLEHVRLIVRPIEYAAGTRLYMIIMEPYTAPRTETPGGDGGDQTYPSKGSSLQGMEEELRRTREELQATIEKLETSNEEIKSSNEELLSMNEELQSANEEHLASQEELQSVNEEIHTVNTELFRKMEDLNSTKDDIENLLKSTNIATLFLDADLRIKWFTPAVLKIFPVIESDVGRPVTDIHTPFQETGWIEEIHSVMRDLVPRERQISFADDNAWYMMRVHPYRTHSNVIDGTVATFVDVTDLQQAKLCAAELALIVESSNDAIVSYELDGTIISWNGGAQSLLGYFQEEMIGQSILRLVPPELTDEQENAQEQVIAGEIRQTQFDTVRLPKDGEAIPVSLSLSPVHDIKGNVIYFAAIMRDITERKYSEEERERLSGQLQEESRHKSDFLAILGHELRNPLAIIASALDLLNPLESLNTEEFRETLEQLRRQVNRLIRLVNDLVDIERISRGTIELRERPLDIGALVSQVARDFMPACKSKSLRLKLELPSDPLWVMGDEDRLSQVIGNLITNSIRFTPEGGTITLSVDKRGEDAVEVQVTDTGEGADPETVSSIFDPFVQPRRGPGLGLGLPLSRGIIELHRGTIQVNSPGVGQGFMTTIQLSAMGQAPQQADSGGDQVEEQIDVPGDVPRKVLIIEDHPEFCLLIAKRLGAYGYEVRTANDGRSGLEIAREFQPDVVVCDVLMPGEMDGHKVGRALNEEPEGLRPALVIALTGFSGAREEQQIRGSGFDMYMMKPPDFQQLRRIISRLKVKK